ncbi:MAG: phosphodiesterase [Clostridia bacterium]|nr:phosphodiesterase [Clostridia bacterium]
MKYLIASDIHGSAAYCRRLLEAFEREGADRLLLLGDVLYHGPRNDLPLEYDPKAVIAMLNPLKEHILCVRGNCDSEVDQMVLEFPIMAEYAIIESNGVTIYATHGHKHGASCPPPLKSGEVLLCGHTHIPANETLGNIRYLNPGSVSIPKNGSKHSYMTLCNGVFVWKDLDGSVYDPTI